MGKAARGKREQREAGPLPARFDFGPQFLPGNVMVVMVTDDAEEAPPGEFCPDCGAPMVVESGLWHCPDCDAYHGGADDEGSAERYPDD
jgi:ribosomal protein L37AE/L43A